VLTLGIDPGTRQLGWGVVARHGARLSHVAHGVIHLDAAQPLALRLVRLEAELCSMLERHQPLVSAVETLFFHKDAQAAAKLGHARGVVLMALARSQIEVFEYAPARVKRTLTGSGQADKRQVALMIRAVLGLHEAPPSDAADALALAVTHLRLGLDPRALGSRLKPRAAAHDENPVLARLRAVRVRRRRRAPF
jgi:crossover junction endodeoxyribonuclease RuvC